MKYLKILAPIVVAVIIETTGVVYYNKLYNPNTYIESVNVSGLTTEEAIKVIEDKINNETIKFFENNKLIKEVSYKDVLTNWKEIEREIYKTEVEEEELAWLKQIFSSTKHNLEKEIDSNKLKTLIADLNKERIAPKNAEIVYENGQYELKNEQRGNLLDIDRIVKDVNFNNTHEIELTQYYVDPTVTVDDPGIKEMFGKVFKKTSKPITISFKDKKEEIPATTVASWVKIEDNEIKINEETIAEDLKFINQKYSAVLNGVDFNSTLQGTVHIQSGTAGWYVDRFNTAKLIKSAILNDESYDITAILADDDKEFSDYVEVDLANQKMFVYRNKEIVVETDIVSGREGTETVPGYYRVWNMETPSVLTGYNPHSNKDYEVPVSYWIAFDDTGQGIHDASWQSSFGGTYHYERGSLGCINTPPSIMSTVYEYVEIGMPVIVF